MENKLKNITKKIRKKMLKMHQKGPHIGPALSIVDILTVLYFDIMNISSPTDPDRDRFVLSKGHSVSALYTVLAEKDFINQEMLDTYLDNDSPLIGHPARSIIPGIEASTGSLGHGLPIGIGMALAAKNDRKEHKIYVLVGDGECQEGSIWEAAMLAPRLKLDNITVIIDANNLQGYDIVENIQPISTFKAKWEAFGWSVKEVDGNNVLHLREILSTKPFEQGKPSVIIAKTRKGAGIPSMENDLKWHYFLVPKDKLNTLTEEIDNQK